MGYYSLICISVLTFSVVSCGSSRKDAARNKEFNSVDTAQRTVMQPDTIPDMPPPPKPAPAPGTLRLQGKIIDKYSAGKNSSTIYEIQVLRTMGMGAGTPAVIRNDTLQIISSKPDPELTETGNIVCLIKHRRTMGKQQDSAARWQLLQWENNTNKD